MLTELRSQGHTHVCLYKAAERPFDDNLYHEATDPGGKLHQSGKIPERGPVRMRAPV